MNTYAYPESVALFKRAAKVIPCGVYGHFSPAPYIPVTDYPFFASRAAGAKFWDVDGNEFIDYMCAYGPMILGYAHPLVEEAYRKQMALADSASIASPCMVELAELLVDMVPVAEWAFFAKNGADVTSYAVMIARAATCRKKIIAFKGGYHGTAPWMQGIGHHGVMEDDHAHVLTVPWNDYEALDQMVRAHAGEVAGLIATPYQHPTFVDSVMPAEGYWNRVEALLKREGIVFIIDDVRCGFRLHLGGSCEHFGFKPDLICFSKAMGNGYPISALVGTAALKTDAAKVFHTGSFWFSAGPMAASIACLNELRRIDGANLIMAIGRTLLDGMVAIAKAHGYTLVVTGAPSMPSLRIAEDESLAFHQRLCGECTKRGAFFTSHHNWFVSAAHSQADIQRTWDILDDAFKALKQQAP